MSYNEIIKTVDSVKNVIEKNFRECMDMGESYTPIEFDVDISHVFEAYKDGRKCKLEDADRLGYIFIRLPKGASTLPLHGLCQFLSMMESEQLISSKNNFHEIMNVDFDGSIDISLDAQKMFDKFGDSNENS